MFPVTIQTPSTSFRDLATAVPHAASSPLAARTSVELQNGSRVAATQVAVDREPLEPMHTFLGIWLDNARDPKNRTRLAINSEGSILSIAMNKIRTSQDIYPVQKKLFEISARDGKLLDELKREFRVDGANGFEVLGQLASAHDGNDLDNWIHRSSNLYIKEITATRGRCEVSVVPAVATVAHALNAPRATSRRFPEVGPQEHAASFRLRELAPAVTARGVKAPILSAADWAARQDSRG